MPHVTFVYPCVGRFPQTRYVRSWQMQPLSIGVLSALTPVDWDRTFFDDRLEPIDFSVHTDLVAISIETFTARRGYQIADEFRRRGIPVVLGGYHATFCPDEAGEHADAVCVGEAEGVWDGILRDAAAGRLASVYSGKQLRPLIGVTPDRSIFRGKNYFKIALVEGGRGCPFRCNFCSISAFYKATYRRRAIEEIVREIEALRVKTVFFVDDNVAGDIGHAKDLLRALIPLRIRWLGQASVNIARDEELLNLMAQSGCVGLLIGFESFSEETLAYIGKPVNRMIDYRQVTAALRQRGISIYGTFMFGVGGDLERSISEAVKFAKRQKLYLTAFNHVVPFPGTPLYETIKSESRLMYDRWWLSPAYRFGQAPYYPHGMSPTQLESNCLEARRQFYEPLSIVRRSIDIAANCATPAKAVYFFGLNWLMRKELGQKYRLPLGVQESDGAQKHHVSIFRAEPGNDAALRDMCWKMPMPGGVRVTYVREPSYFEALSVEGRHNDVIVGRDTTTNQIIGAGSRSVKSAYINGGASTIGYLSSLRIMGQYRRTTLLARGYNFLRQLHADGRTKLYLTTIVDGNRLAMESIASGRAGLPVYHEYGRYDCMALDMARTSGENDDNKVSIRPATERDIAGLVQFWQSEGPKKQFFPQYDVKDMGNGGMLREIKPTDILIAFSGGALVGTVALWDQHAFRQSVISGYSRALTILRPAYNLLTPISGFPTLPKAGSRLDCCYLSLVCVKNNDPRIFARLLSEAIQVGRTRHSILMAGFHERDSLLAELRRYPHFSYHTRLYVVYWEDGQVEFNRLDNRVPYLELGAL